MAVNTKEFRAAKSGGFGVTSGKNFYYSGTIHLKFLKILRPCKRLKIIHVQNLGYAQ